LQLFFEGEVLDKYPRQLFLPWETVPKSRKTTSTDQDHLYLMRVTMKKQFPVHPDHFVPFYCFMKTLYGLGKSYVIPTCEKWIPGSGASLILPKLKHEDYFEDINIFTQFKELSPVQILAIYRELSTHSNYSTSPFMDMIEQEWLKAETIDTYLNDSHNKNPTPSA